MEIELTPELERYIQHQVESGNYRSADDLIHTALRLLDRTGEAARLRNARHEGIDDLAAGRHESMEEVRARFRAERAARTAELRRELDPAIAELERGEGIPGPSAFEQARAEFRRLTGRGAVDQGEEDGES